MGSFSSLFFNGIKLQRRLMRYLLLVCAVCVLIQSGVYYFLSFMSAKENYLKSFGSANLQVSELIDTRMEQVEGICNFVNYNLFWMHSLSKNTNAALFSSFRNVRNIFGSLKSSFLVYDIRSFISPQAVVSAQGGDFLPLDRIADYGLATDKLIRGARQYQWHMQPGSSFLYSSKSFSVQEDVISCWGHYSDVRSNETYYAYAVYLQCAEFNALLASSFPDSAISSYLIDDRGVIWAAKSSERIGDALLAPDELTALINSGAEAMWLGEDHCLTKQVGERGLYLVTLIPDAYLLPRIPSFLNTLLVTSVLVYLMILILSISFSQRFTGRLSILTGSIAQLKPANNEAALKPLFTLMDRPNHDKDEVDQLAETLVAIVRQNDQNVSDLIQMSLKEEQLRYQLLRAKINPHFLYNILDSIQSCLNTGRLEIARQMVYCLARFYREVLHTSDALIPISEELRICELYLQIESLCRNRSFDWSISLDDSIEEFLIPKFVLQPILENCVLHALHPDGERLHIQISITYEKESILIRVTDNGIGIPKEKLEDLRSALDSDLISEKKYFAISNVNHRLLSFFSNVKHLEIQSQEGEGTSVTLRLKQIL